MKKTFIAILVAFVLPCINAWAAGALEEGEATSAATSKSKYSEAPVLEALVTSGALPPVHKRLPDEPKVRKPLQEIGTYGGTLTVFSTDPNPWQVLGGNPEGNPYPIRMNFDGSIEPDMALDYELADDYMSLTLFLREGHRWSNGDLFTAEDFVFYYYEMVEKELSFTWGASSNVKSITAVDEYTVHWEYNKPFPRALHEMLTYEGTEWNLYAATMWLKQWHIEYNIDAQTLAKEEGFETWQDAFKSHSESSHSTTDLNIPSLQPFIPVERDSNVLLLERNPYYFAVDPIGQQLPYIDRVVMEEVDTEEYRAKVIAGQADFADNMTLADYPLLVQNQEAGDYKINLIESWYGNGDLGYLFSLNHRNPAKRGLFNNDEFGGAISLALNREAKTNALFLRLGVAPQVKVIDLSSSYELQWGDEHPYLRHDPDEASRMLDALGLDKRNAEGTRLMSNGEPLILKMAYGMDEMTPQVGFELTKEYWEAVGIGVDLKSVKWAIIYQNRLDGALIAPYPLVYRSNLINVPDRIATLVGGSIPLNLYGDQFFFKK